VTVCTYTGVVCVSVRLLVHVQEEHQRSWQQHEDEKLHKRPDKECLSASTHAKNIGGKFADTTGPSCTNKIAPTAKL